MNEQLNRLAEQLGRQLSQRQQRLVLAESCTGGLIAKILTDIPGSSAWFDRGYVSYSNESKQEMLGVDSGLIQQQGAVSEAVVRAMAEGALQRSRAQCAAAVSGIAGPDGGSDEKPVGTVWLAWAWRDGETLARCVHFQGDRAQVRSQSAKAIIEGLLAPNSIIEGGAS